MQNLIPLYLLLRTHSKVITGRLGESIAGAVCSVTVVRWRRAPWMVFSVSLALALPALWTAGYSRYCVHVAHKIGQEIMFLVGRDGRSVRADRRRLRGRLRRFRFRLLVYRLFGLSR